jgi:hypothetical protein
MHALTRFSFALALLLGLSGCATSTSRPVTVSLRASGDPGVSVRVRSTTPGVPEQVAHVPAELTFTGKSFDLFCIHGTQPGRLNLIISRGGISMSTADTTRPGEVTHFVVRPDSLSIGMPQLPPVK